MARRIAVTIVGVALLIVGVVLVVAPGPGLLVLALALLVLGTEYEWARRHYTGLRRRADDAAARAVSNYWSLAISIVGVVAIIGAGVALIVVDELPFSGFASGLSLAVGGAIALGTLVYAYVRRDKCEDVAR